MKNASTTGFPDPKIMYLDNDDQIYHLIGWHLNDKGKEPIKSEENWNSNKKHVMRHQKRGNYEKHYGLRKNSWGKNLRSRISWWEFLLALSLGLTHTSVVAYSH